MTNQQEALKLALEATKVAKYGHLDHAWANEVIAKCEEALAQPDQEKVRVIDGVIHTLEWTPQAMRPAAQRQPPLPMQPQPIGEGFFLPGQEPVLMQERRAKRMSGGVVTQWSSWYSSKYRTPDEAKADEFFADHIPHEWRHLYVETPQPKPQPEQEPASRTDQQIIQQTEELAVWLLSWGFNHQPETSIPMRESTHPFAERCWAAACHIQEMLTATDPENSVAELDVTRPPPPQRQPLTDDIIGLLKEARKIIRASSSRNLVKDWDARATSAIAAHGIRAKT